MTHFSVELGPRGSAPDYEALQTICLEAERLGYYALYLPDGVQWTDFECWTTLTRLAASTSTIRLGPAATFVTYRHPTLLAKTASTLDILSGGRLELRLGPGGASAKIDQVHSGIPQPDSTIRVEMLGEGLHVIRRLWNETVVTFEGNYFTAKDAECWPKPLQTPHPPITVCANSRRMLRIAAEQADVWEASGSLGEHRRRMEFFRTCCQTVGRGFDGVKKSLEITVAIAESDREAEEMVRTHRASCSVTRGSSYDPLVAAVVGRPDRCAEAILEFVGAGVSSFTVFFIGLRDLLPIRLFADKVMPAVKDFEVV